MAYSLNPYAYRRGNSILHRLPGGLKLFLLLLLSSAVFLFGPPAQGLAAFFIIAGSLAAGIRPWELLRGIKPLLYLCFLAILLRSFNFRPPFLNVRGLGEALVFSLGILVAFTAGALLFSVTTMTELKESLSRIETAFFRLLFFRTGKRSYSRISLGISLMLGFLPRFFEVWEAANLAYRARAGKKGMSRFIILLPLVTERMIEVAAETAEAMESRGVLLR
ncbi:MAG: energy-coupling factor transporter transmembrane protein EcfT [Treponema sp.]|jgi:biotin transport system permease protein|nr:energy-coupling factor transporter transmembrane protein EcfT [Treponema sp.]